MPVKARLFVCSLGKVAERSLGTKVQFCYRLDQALLACVIKINYWTKWKKIKDAVYICTITGGIFNEIYILTSFSTLWIFLKTFS